MVVAAEINGTPVTMIVDTGAQWTAVTPQAAKRLNLPPDARHGGLHRGVATFSSNINVVVDRFKIGGIDIAGRSLAVVPLPPGIAESPRFAGLLGGDFLYRYDLDIDLQGRTLTLYRNGGCAVGVPPWGLPVVSLPLVKSGANRLITPVSVDGHPFHAIIDTGATASLITRPNALRAGVSSEALDRDPEIASAGLGTTQFMTRRHAFDALQVGPDRFPRPVLLVSGALLGGGDMLLGLDYLGRRRVWISYALRRMFVAAPP